MTDSYREDLKGIRDEILDTLREGFRGVHARQDVTNGRVRAGEILTAEHSIRLKNIEREIFEKRDPFDRRRDESGVHTVVRQIEDRPWERDVKIVLGTLGSVGGVVLFFKQLLPWLVKVLTP
jgi:hypothetical protein